jgi:hypothetical protein
MGKVSRRGPVWVGIIAVVVFFAGVTLAVATLGGGPDIPHATAGANAACTSCHAVDRLPESHRDRSDDGCRSCHTDGEHAEAAAAEPRVDTAGDLRVDEAD